MTAPRVISVNVGAILQVEWRGRMVSTGIWKHPTATRVAIRGVNFDGDDQADRTVHGGTDKAVYAYSREDYDLWREVERMETPPGLFGENLTVEGIDLSLALVGEQWVVGSATLEVTQPRLPCYKLGIRVGDPHFPKRFMAASRMGAYLRVIREGAVGAGDAVVVTARPDHGVALNGMVDALKDPVKAQALRAVPRLPQFWRDIVIPSPPRPVPER